MNNNFITIDIVFDKKSAEFEIGEKVRGEVHIRVKKDISYKYFRLNNILEIRGNAKPFTLQKGTKVTIEGKWEVGEVYEYPFVFEAGDLPSFNGQHLRTISFIEATFLLTEESRKETGTYHHIKEAFDINKIESYKKVYITENLSKKFKVEATQFSIPIQSFHFLASIGFLLFFYSLIGGNFKGFFNYIFFLIPLCSAIYFGAIFFRDYYYFHNLDISLSDEEPDFIQVKILLNGRENPLRNLKMGYKVVEKVVKQNGSSKHVLTNDCYKFSYPQPLIEKQGTITARFPFQEYPNYPPSFAHESKEINWFVFFQIPGLLSSKTKDVPIKVSYKN